MKKSIPRKLTEYFIAQKKLPGIAGFFRYLAMPTHAKIFIDYAQNHGHAISLPENFQFKVLFHGSQHHAEILIASHKEKVVYATEDPNYAIFLAILNLKNANAGVSIKKGKTNLSVDLAFVNGISSFKNGWIHVVSTTHFKRVKNHEYISKEPIEVLFSIPIKPDDLTLPVKISIS